MGKGVVFVCLLAAVAIIGASSGPAAATTGGGSGSMMSSSAAPTIVQAGNVKWTPVKGFSGVESAILWGDPTKAGDQYAERYKFADGVTFPPHTHPRLEQVTVISGTLLAGIGKTVDASKMVTLPAGSFVALPANVPHYVKAQGETVVEVHGIGPDTIDMVK
jgi:quercetin dioxygenase-like cupin family protein